MWVLIIVTRFTTTPAYRIHQPGYDSWDMVQHSYGIKEEEWRAASHDPIPRLGRPTFLVTMVLILILTLSIVDYSFLCRN